MLETVDARVNARDFLLVTGSNGAGKTTLLRILATTLRPSTGRLVWGEWAAGASPEEIRRRIGFVAHQPLVYDELSALENVEFIAKAHGVADPRRSAERCLDAFGLGSRRGDRASGFSRGMRQRLALAHAFVVEPRLLLLDEPATSLDAEAVGRLVDQLGHIRDSTSVVLATHDPAPFERLATRRWSLENGRPREAAS